MYTLKNGTVIDGTGGPRFTADVIINDDGRIEACQPGLAIRGVPVDVTGKVVCPGFIDMHTHSQLMAFVDAGLPPKITQGITTELFGQDGLGTFPMIPKASAMWRAHLSGLDCNPSIEWNWTSADGYMNRLPRGSSNVATLIGHGNVRLCVMGMANRPASDQELEAMGELVHQCMVEGAFGFSTGLIYAPCVYADTREISFLNRVVAEHGGIFVTHMRNEGDYIWPALDEVFSVARETGVHLHISHLKLTGKGNWGKSVDLVRRIEEGRSSGLKITADQYPYTASSTMLGAILPTWVHAEGIDGLRRLLRDSAQLERIRNEMEQGVPGKRSIVREAGYHAIMVSSVESDRNREIEGLRLTDIAAAWKSTPFDAAVRLLLDEDFAVGMITFSIGEEDVQHILKAPWRAMGTDGLLGGKPHPRTFGSVPRILGHYSRDLGILSLEEAVRKMTSLPAEILGLPDRGVVSPGKVADVVVFDPDAVRETSTYEDPKHYAAGIPYVFVGGRPVVWENVPTNERPGVVLRRRL